MLYYTIDAAKRLQGDKSIRCVILSGKGKAFCTGLDVKSMMQNPSNLSKLLSKPGGTAHSNLVQDVGYLWRQLHCPVIASIHGMCFGGGMQIALGCDFRIVTSDCKLSIMEAKWGLIPDMSATVSLRELIRIDIAKELTMTGRIITGDEALKIGLITQVSSTPFEHSLNLAHEISQNSPDSVNATKKLYQNTYRHNTEEYALNLETSMQQELIGSWNQILKATSNFGLKFPFSTTATKDF